ncbi:putative oxalocrotonate tautomerase [Mycena sp. CBHHK59/15]|nr:putative oxalocrotonate tautomerase [Mycena sp. CBHHK59/15]
MPLHRFFIPKGIVPPSYVVILFIDIDPANFFVGGKSTGNFLCIAVEHTAQHFADHVYLSSDKAKHNFMDRYEKALEPFTRARGIDWEVKINDVDRTLWNENGIAPPEVDTEEEKYGSKRTEQCLLI